MCNGFPEIGDLECLIFPDKIVVGVTFYQLLVISTCSGNVRPGFKLSSYNGDLDPYEPNEEETCPHSLVIWYVYEQRNSWAPICVARVTFVFQTMTVM